MTTTAFPIDRDLITEVELPESSEKGKTWLSSFSVPLSIHLEELDDGNSRVVFSYPGGEEPLGGKQTFTNEQWSQVTVALGRSTRKVLYVHATGRLLASDFRKLADLLDALAKNTLRLAERMSYRLSAAALRLVSPPPRTSKQTVLRFTLETDGNFRDLFERFSPNGKRVLNRTTWRGKEPRTCGVTNVTGRLSGPGTTGKNVCEIEVSYRPKGTISYVGGTRFDGWTAMMLNRTSDGTLLDSSGQPLPPGAPPIYLPFEGYADVEFNDIDFGEFRGEFEVEGVKHVAYEDAMREIYNSGVMNVGFLSDFTAPRRHRPTVKILIADSPPHNFVDGFGTEIFVLNSNEPHLQHVVADQMTSILQGYIEGRYMLKTMGSPAGNYVDISDILVDSSKENSDERFNCLERFVPANFMDDLGARLAATYALRVSIVAPPRSGFVFRHEKKK